MISENVSVLNDRRQQNQPSRRPKGNPDPVYWIKLQALESGSQRPEQPALQRFVIAQEADKQHHKSGDECQQGELGNFRPMKPGAVDKRGVKRCRAVFFSGPTDDGDEYGFKKQQQHARCNSGNSQTTLAQQWSNDEVQGHEKADGFKSDAARPSRDGVSGGKEFNGTMRQQQHS